MKHEREVRASATRSRAAAKPANRAKAKPANRAKAKPANRAAAKPTNRAAATRVNLPPRRRTNRATARPETRSATRPALAPARGSEHANTPIAPRAPDWRPTLRAALDETGSDFAAYLASRAGGPWEHADCPELAGLEAWGTELAARDLRAGVGALVRAAQYGLPIILDRAGIGLDGMGFKADEPHGDGAPVERQLQLAAAWLDAPDDVHVAAVRAGNDPARQMPIWDDDLRPNDDRAHWWYLDVGQCSGHAITRPLGSGDANAPSYYGWPAEVCVGRGLVICVRGLRCRGARIHDLLGEIRAVLAA